MGGARNRSGSAVNSSWPWVEQNNHVTSSRVVVGVAGGFDGHAADGVGGHGGEPVEGAVFEPQDPVGDLAEPVVVADDDDAAAVLFGEAAEETGDLPSVAGVEVGGRFVGEGDGGVVGERAGDGNALLLAAGELVGSEGEAFGEHDALEEAVVDAVVDHASTEHNHSPDRDVVLAHLDRVHPSERDQ